jgi:signal transduction histidine kinase
VEKTSDAKKSVGAFMRKKTLQTTLQQVSQQMYARNTELADTNRTLSLLQTIDTLALDSLESLDTICGRIADAISAATDYPLVAILTSSSSDADKLNMRGLVTKGVNLPASVFDPVTLSRLMIDKSWFIGKDRGRTVQIKDLEIKEITSLFSCSKEMARQLQTRLPLRSLYVVNLIARSRLVGVMVAGFVADAGDILTQDMQLLDRLSEPTGVALDNRLLFEENRRVVQQLQRSNKKLKNLDATKDDFISMASHQLRTPLTSVKGYLSMVLEGDAGKLNTQQAQLLSQSYASSQRMVFLISDLLNLSRLNTGKFVIEAKPVDLAEIVQSEVDQLTETAKSREITMLYIPPKKLPKLMLDETKIHQVVMNFMDNAIYYTRAGGKVTISLKETATAVEFTVKDNGIGVPRAEQHHLFSKFYRADNARQARPDGTGLGLFMAKKVIAAQGGAILFDSVEGKGSTFGFHFAKATHAAIAQPTASESKA